MDQLTAFEIIKMALFTLLMLTCCFTLISRLYSLLSGDSDRQQVYALRRILEESHISYKLVKKLPETPYKSRDYAKVLAIQALITFLCAGMVFFYILTISAYQIELLQDPSTTWSLTTTGDDSIVSVKQFVNHSMFFSVGNLMIWALGFILFSKKYTKTTEKFLIASIKEKTSQQYN